MSQFMYILYMYISINKLFIHLCLNSFMFSLDIVFNCKWLFCFTHVLCGLRIYSFPPEKKHFSIFYKLLLYIFVVMNCFLHEYYNKV